ncbi:MAG: DinB family protein [Actinomycetota bacterium]
MAPSAPGLQTFYDGWANHHRLVRAAIRELTSEQLALWTAPHQWSVWQLAGHMAGSRSYWFHDVLGEGDATTRDLFRVARTTVPGLSLEDAGWEDDEEHPRGAAEIVEALDRTWTMIDDCLRRWTPDDLAVGFTRERRSGTETVTRQWVIWHLMEHDVHHGGEISQILGSHGVPALVN